MSFDLALRFARLFAECVAVIWFLKPGEERLFCVTYRVVAFWLIVIFGAGICAWYGCVASGVIVTITVVALWCVFRSGKRNQFKVDVVFGVVLSTLFELCYLFGFKSVIFVDDTLREFGLDLPWKVTTALTAAFEFVALWVLCSSRVLRRYDVESISANKYVLFLFSACLTLVVYVKECLKVATKYSRLYEVLWCIVLMLIPVYVAFYVILSKVTRSKNMDYNYNIDGVIENGLETPGCCAAFSIYPCSHVYESEKVAFRRRLNSLNIDHGFKGYSQLILCLVVIKCSESVSAMDLRQGTFKRVSDFTKTDVDALCASFADIVSSVWLHGTAESLQCGYITDDDDIKSHVPTVEEFVLHLVETTCC